MSLAGQCEDAVNEKAKIGMPDTGNMKLALDPVLVCGIAVLAL